MASESKKRLALAIIDFLTTCTTDGTLSADEAESIEIAKQLIADSFGVDPTDKAALADALDGKSLLSIYAVFERMKGRAAKAPAPPTAAAVPPASASKPAALAQPTEAQKAEAEKIKGQGNSAMQRKDYQSAIELYSKALELTPGNPIFLSNRAAAYSASHQHDKAAVDAQAAVDVDPKYSKAWSRLGLARFALGDTRGSMVAYERGMEAEGGKNASEAMRRGYETAKRRLAEEEGEVEEPVERTRSPPGAGPGGDRGMPDFGSLASMFGGGGGGGGPDLAGLLSNPMVAQMAQSLMKNPDLVGKMMNNPKLKEMMEGVGGGGGGGGGGGLPDLGSLMSDPSIAEMAKNFMGGAGKGGGSSST